VRLRLTPPASARRTCAEPFTHALLPAQTSFVRSLIRLCETEANDLFITKTTYALDEHSYELYDVKCRTRFEDETIDRIAKDWPSKNPDCGPVCPLRRGVCVGLIDELHVVLAVGNVKFFYADSDAELVSHPGSLLLTEKANGEYTMATLVASRFLVVGSKNVRVCLPFSPRDEAAAAATAAADTMLAFRALFGADTRFTYVGEMLELWLEALSPSARGLGAGPAALLGELERGTLVGEQVGVHAHIFAGYSRPSIRLFGSLQTDVLTTSIGCNLADLRARLLRGNGGGGGEADAALSFVSMREFALPGDAAEARRLLEEVAGGPMEEHGEGVVAYLYDAERRALRLFKYKNEEYHLDRRLRSLLSPLAAELARQGATFARLRDETERIRVEMDKVGWVVELAGLADGGGGRRGRSSGAWRPPARRAEWPWFPPWWRSWTSTRPRATARTSRTASWSACGRWRRARARTTRWPRASRRWRTRAWRPGPR
jgi:hypothetical protein